MHATKLLPHPTDFSRGNAPASEYQFRRDRVREDMVARGIDILVS